MNTTIHRGDLLAHLSGHAWMVMNGYAPKAHAVLCDPPYFLGSMTKRFGKPNSAPAKWGAWEANEGRTVPFGNIAKGFMGQSWDGFKDVWEYQAWCAEWGRLLLSFVHPGALLMAFGGTRTYHRLAAGLEDAGWIVGDSLMWVTAQGFPKSHNISKAIDKAAGEETIIATQPDRWTQKGGVLNFSTDRPQSEVKITTPSTDAARQWDGYGTALSPAYEPIILARAPWTGTYAGIAQEYGTGAINVEGGRIPSSSDGPKGWETPRGGIWATDKDAKANLIENPNGRWPKNLILGCSCESDDHAPDCPIAIMGAQSGESVSTNAPRNNGLFKSVAKGWDLPHTTHGHTDSGTAARFFFQAKAAKWEREAGLRHRATQTVNDGRDTPIDNPYQRGETERLNVHPTVKPIKLTEYLATLMLPPALSEPRRILIPFSGSGSEMIGAMLAGWDDVTGFEQSDEYADIAEARIAWWSQFSDYDAAKRAYDADMGEQQIRDDEADHGLRQMSIFDEAIRTMDAKPPDSP